MPPGRFLKKESFYTVFEISNLGILAQPYVDTTIVVLKVVLAVVQLPTG